MSSLREPHDALLDIYLILQSDEEESITPGTLKNAFNFISELADIHDILPTTVDWGVGREVLLIWDKELSLKGKDNTPAIRRTEVCISIREDPDQFYATIDYDNRAVEYNFKGPSFIPAHVLHAILPMTSAGVYKH